MWIEVPEPVQLVNRVTKEPLKENAEENSPDMEPVPMWKFGLQVTDSKLWGGGRAAVRDALKMVDALESAEELRAKGERAVVKWDSSWSERTKKVLEDSEGLTYPNWLRMQYMPFEDAVYNTKDEDPRGSV